MAELYRQLGADLMTSERPKNLDADAKEQYDVLLEEQAFPFEEKAIELHETNAQRTGDGVYDEWVQRSFDVLAKLKPARYAKTEISEDYVPTLLRCAYSSAAPARRLSMRAWAENVCALVMSALRNDADWVRRSRSERRSAGLPAKSAKRAKVLLKKRPSRSKPVLPPEAVQQFDQRRVLMSSGRFRRRRAGISLARDCVSNVFRAAVEPGHPARQGGQAG